MRPVSGGHRGADPKLAQLGEVVLQLGQPCVALTTVHRGGVDGGTYRVCGGSQPLIVDLGEMVAQRPVHGAQL
jgi:hypothetical protein